MRRDLVLLAIGFPFGYLMGDVLMSPSSPDWHALGLRFIGLAFIISIAYSILGSPIRRD